MARIKSPVLNSHPNPSSMDAAQIQDGQDDKGEMDTASGFAPQSTSSKRCPNCNSRLSNLSESEFDDHVDQCSSSPSPVGAPATALPASGVSSPLSLFSRSPSPVSDIPIPPPLPQEMANGAVSIGVAVKEDTALHSGGQGDTIKGTTSQLYDQNEDNINLAGDIIRVEDPIAYDAMAQSISGFSSPGIQRDAYPNISAYVTTEVKEEVNGKAVARLEYVMEMYDVGDDLPTVLNIDDVDVEDIEVISTPILLNENEDSAPTDDPEVATDTELETQPAALEDDQIPQSQLEEPSIAKDTVLPSKSKPANKFPFRKLAPAEEFTEYLSNPEDMSFEELYYKTSQTANALRALQEEYDLLDVLTKEDDVYQKSKAREAKQAAKLVEEEKLRDEEPELVKVLEEYEEQLRQREKGWKISLDEIHKSGIRDADPDKYARLMRLRNDAKLRAEMTEKMTKAQQASSDVVRNLVDVPLPKLTAEDYKNEKVKKRTYLESHIRFDDKKQMDAYGLPYSAAEGRIGNQDLKDRNAVDENGDSLYENGRPKRSRAKRTVYDTEASEAPSPEEEEVLPAKRRRVQRNPEDADVLGGDDISRAQSPTVRTFPSGKRIGRPPKSQAKSRLNEAHVPPVLAEYDDDDQSPSADEQEPVKKQRGARAQLLDSSQEHDLISSATALVEQTLSEHGTAEAPPRSKPANVGRPKGRGGRPKKQQNVDDDLSDVEKPAAKARGGKAKRKSTAKKLSNQYVDDDEILQSTEQDDQSRFASASTSRPTSASSRMSRSTFGSRANSRPQEFGPSGGYTVESAAAGVSTRGRGGKRKLNGIDNPQNGDVDDGDIVDTPPKRRKIASKKQSLIAEDLEEIADEASNPRPKRKRAATIADSIEVVRPEQWEDVPEADEAPTKKRIRTKAPKLKAPKIETESDFFEDEDENSAPRKKQNLAAKKGVSNRDNSALGDQGEADAVDLGESDGDEDGPDTEPVTKKGRAPTKKPRVKKDSTRKPKGKGLGEADDFEANLKETDPEAYEALMLKKAQKSAKLSASAKARWASGLMKGPMEKRARTNAAKAAAKKAGGGSLATTPGASIALEADGSEKASASPQDYTQIPSQPPFSEGVFQAAAQPPPFQPSPTSAPANPAPIRNSKRPRKPTLKAPGNNFSGMDGASDELPRSQMSTYDTFQALSSPGSPMVLGKRIRRQLVNAQPEDDDDDDDYGS